MAFVPALAAGAQAVGQYAEGRAEKAAGEHNARINERNAVVSGQRTESDVATMRRDQARALGAMRAAYGASGVSMDGSPTDVFNNSVIESELDILNRRYSGELEAMGFRESADVDRMRGKTASRSANTGAAVTLLGAAYKGSKAGKPVRVSGG